MGVGPLKYYPDRKDNGHIIEETYFQISKLSIDDSTIWPNPREIQFGNFKNAIAPFFVEVKDMAFTKD